MRVAVCCPGPSLIRRWRSRAGYDRVIAVNRALMVVRDADWLSAGDITMLQDHLPADVRPSEGVLTFDAHRDQVAADPTWRRLQILGWSDLAMIAAHADHGRPLQWSVQAALCHAAELGAHAIDLVGADAAASGTIIDCTGHPGESRGPARWEREEADLALTRRLLEQRGVALHRVAP